MSKINQINQINQIKDKVINQTWIRIYHQNNHKVKNKVWEQVMTRSKINHISKIKQVKEQVYQVWTQSYLQIDYKVISKICRQVEAQINNQVWAPLGQSIYHYVWSFFD